MSLAQVGSHLFVILLGFTLLTAVRARIDRNPDIELKTPELIKKYGYPSETHQVETRDGYLLGIHRIPISRRTLRNNRRVSNKLPILLQHGLGGSSADWILMGPGKSLGYILADQGYDVWLGNNRGNLYSRNHSSIPPTNKTFWDFSYHELGIYDLPDTIDYILSITSAEQLYYVGHSQGTTQFFVMTSTKPEYNSKIKLMAGLAPAAFVTNIRGPVRRLASLAQLGTWVGETYGWPEFGSRSAWGKIVSNMLCSSSAPTQFICSNLLFLVAGFNWEDLNTDALTVIIGHVPAGASWKQIVHFGQGFVNPDTFRQFDYGDLKNFQLYGAFEPPDYELDRITAPVVLFSSDNDWLATSKDIELLQSKLSNVSLNHRVQMNSFNHYDFIWGKTAPEVVSKPLLQMLKDFQ